MKMPEFGVVPVGLRGELSRSPSSAEQGASS